MLAMAPTAQDTIAVRRLGPDDAATYWALRLRGLKEHPEAFTSSYAEEATRSPDFALRRLGAQSASHFWGAFVNGVLAGTMGLDFEPRQQSRHKGKVIGVFVPVEFTGRGLGRRMLQALTQDARANHLELLVLTVTANNQSAEQLYLSQGFTRFGVEPMAIKVAGQYFDKVHMAVKLV
jgi:ribosomal protein S18 acetylase RimI-like enzyme